LTVLAVTGGVPKYLEQLDRAGAFELDTILVHFIVENSLFLEEGKHLLIEEFGRDYANYFAILELISVGQKYSLKDHFLRFWFRFIYRHQSTAEIGNYSYIKQIIKRDFSTFTGPVLEQIFQEQLIESHQFTQINLSVLSNKAQKLRQKRPDYQIVLKGFSLDDLDNRK